MDILILLAPAFIAGALVSLVHVPLGQEVLRRGIIFLDLAVAQCAALGMIIFQLVSHGESGLFEQAGLLISGLVFALICAMTFHRLEPITGRYQEALIGCTFVGAAAAAMLFMAHDPHGGEEMKNILAGQILWTSWADLLMAAPVYICIFCIWIFLGPRRQTLFYPLFALTIPFSVQLLGIYLVFASLIFPALAVAAWKKRKLLAGWGLSLAAFLAGLLLSYFLDWPAGPAIIMMFAIFSLGSGRLLRS